MRLPARRAEAPGLGLTALGLTGPLVAFLAVWAAGRQTSAVAAVVACAALPALIVALVRPDLTVTAVGALVMANAGLVLGDGYGIPNVTRAGLLVATAAVVLHRPTREAGLAAGPVLGAFVVYAGVRLWSGLANPDALGAGDVLQDLVFGGAVLVTAAAAGGSEAMLRRLVAGLVGAAAAISAAIQLKLVGVGGAWFGFAGDIALTPGRADAAQRSLVNPSQEGRVAGPVGDPNFWAQALIIALPLAVWLAWTAPSRLRRLVAAAAATLIALDLLETGSRGGLLALTVAGAVFLWHAGGRARRLIWVLPVAFALVLVSSGSLDRFTQLGGVIDPYSAEDESVRGRFSENLAALKMLADHPLTGVGAGNYPLEYRSYARDIGLDSKNEERHAHNSYLEAGAESGLPGLAAFAALLGIAGLAVVRARRAFAERDMPDWAGFAAALGVSVLGYAISAVFLHQGYPDYLWLLLGLVCATWVLSGAASRRRTTL